MNFKALENYLDHLLELGVPGCELRVWKDHHQIFAHCSGEAEAGRAMQGNEIYWVYSATKVVTATAVLQLIESGDLSLNDLVSDYLPAYKHLNVLDKGIVRPAKTEMTIKHLLTMCSGLNYDCNSQAVKDCIQHYGASASTIQVVQSFAAQPLDFDPGTHWQYSLSHDVLAAIIEVVTGIKFSDYINLNIIQPLGIENMTFHPTAQQIQRLAARYYWDGENHLVEVEKEHLNTMRFFQLSDAYESGGAGLLSDAESYIRFADALANGGVGKNGARILTPAYIDLMRMDHLDAETAKDFANKVVRPGYSYGLGVRTLVDESKSRSAKGEFGWDGTAGAWTLIDPQNRIAAFYVQHVIGWLAPQLEYQPRIRDLIYEGLQS